MPSKPIVISGIQPTGNLHIGNYLGAVRNWVDLQNSGKYDMYIFIADLHALTGNHTVGQAQTMTTAMELMAAGIDPGKTTFFIQSRVPGHTDLGWIFNTVTPVAELYRMTQFKDKSSRQEKNINTGLLTYPTLMAADILLYRAAFIPVGEDQIQHVELTNDVARWFNNRFGDYFKPVKPLLTTIPRVMSLLEPTKKMSKSLGGGHVLELTDEPNVIEEKLKKAVTATAGGAGSPGALNLLGLLKEFGDVKEFAKFSRAEKDGTIRYGELKQALAKAVSRTFADFRARLAELRGDQKKVEKTLQTGAEKAAVVAQKTLNEVKKIIGLL